MRTRVTWNDLLHPGKAIDFFSRGEFPPFDPAAKGYSAANALWLMELSRLVYRHDIEEEDAPPQPGRSAFLAKAGLRQLFFISKETGTTHTQAMLVESASSPPFAVLVFRGTEQLIKDFLTDLEVGIEQLLSDAPDVHNGFLKAFHSIWSAIEPELLKLSCPVFYTGHSLGGALATLAASRRQPKALYTFGSPRVGNSAFAKSLANVPICRVVNGQDAVTHLPPEFLKFVHTGELHHLLKRSRRHVRNLVDWILRIFGGPPRNLADHAPINYVDRILEQQTD